MMHGQKNIEFIWVNHYFIKLCFDGLSVYFIYIPTQQDAKFKIIWRFPPDACERICIFVFTVKNFSNHAENIRLPPYKISVSWQPGTWGLLHLWFIRQRYDLFDWRIILKCSWFVPHFRYTRVGTLIVATIYLQLIQNRYMFRSFTVLQFSHQHCVQPVASDVEVVGYL